MKIYCMICYKFLGEIRDGTIRKNTAYVCGECQKLESGKKTDDLPDILKDLFGCFGDKV